MSTVTAISVRPSGLSDFTDTRRFTVAEYHRLIAANILTEDEPVELLGGYVVTKPDHFAVPPADGPFPEWRGLWRWTVEEYQRMAELGIIGPDERVELLDGYVVPKMPQNLPHRAAVMRLTTRLAGRVPAGWVVMTQCPIRLPGTEPEPDGAILRGVDTDYDARHPGPADIGVVIEVSESSLATDRGPKGHLHARAGIPVYWIINVVDRVVEVYTDPDPAATPPGYRTRTDFAPGQDVPLVLDGVEVGHIPVADLLP
ncbi:MAG: Uma2 family endonuclease [Fimbriiglobus sp.]